MQDLSNNQIKELPRDIGYLTKLFKLNISYNKISDLPLTIGDISCKKVFVLIALSNKKCGVVPGPRIATSAALTLGRMGGLSSIARPRQKVYYS